MNRAIAFSAALVDLDRVEVLRGPQGTLYGRNTTGGAISLYTRDPDSRDVSGYLSGEIGNYDHYKVSGAINVPLVRDALAVRLVASFSDRDGYGQSAVEKLGASKEKYFRGKIRFDDGGPFKASLTVDYGDVTGTNSLSKLLTLTSLSAAANRPGQVTAANPATAAAVQIGALSPQDILIVAAGNPGGFSPAERASAGARIQAAVPVGYATLRQSLAQRSGGTFPDNDFYRNTTTTRLPIAGDRLGGALTMSYDFSDRLTLTSVTGYQDSKRSSILDIDTTPISILEVNNRQTSEFWSQETQLAYASDRLSVIVGGYYSHETGRDNSDSISLGAINAVTQQLLTDFNYKTLGFFGQADFKVTDTLKVTGGIRWSEERKMVDLQSTNRNRNTGVISCRLTGGLDQGGCHGVVNPKFSDISWLASVDFKPVESTLLYVKAARGFRGGGVNFRSATPLEAMPFRPELVTEYEAGAKFANDMRTAQFNVALFHDKYSDIQRSVVVASGSGASTVVRNAAEATIWGIEADWTLRPSNRFELSGNFSYLNAGFDEYFTSNAAGAQIDLKDTPFIVPDISIAVAAKYTLPTSFGSMFARVDYDLISDRYIADNAVDRNSVRQDGYGLMGARLQLNFEAWDASLAVFGTNLTNKKYLVGGVGLDGSLGFNFGVTGTPRMYGISFTKRFGGD